MWIPPGARRDPLGPGVEIQAARRCGARRAPGDPRAQREIDRRGSPSRARRLLRLRDDLQRAVIVAVSLVGMMEVTVHQIVDVVAVGHGLVPTARAMDVGGVVPLACVAVRASGRVGVVHLDPVLVVVAVVRMVQVPIVQVVHVALVPDRDVPAALAMLVVVLVSLVAHDDEISRRSSDRCQRL